MWTAIYIPIMLMLFRFGGRDFGGRGGGSSGGGFSGSSFKNSQPGESLRRPKWDLTKLQPFERSFYKEHPNVTARSDVSSRKLINYQH